MSPEMQEAHKRAQRIESKLTARDRRFGCCVQVVHEEGTVLFFNCAFALKEGVWYYIFTEHHGFHVYHEEDVLVRQFGEQLAIEFVKEEDLTRGCSARP